MLAATSLVFGAAYMLILYKKVMFGAITNAKVEKLTDLTRREKLIFTPLIILTILIGIYPNIITDILHVSVFNLLAK